MNIIEIKCFEILQEFFQIRRILFYWDYYGNGVEIHDVERETVLFGQCDEWSRSFLQLLSHNAINDHDEDFSVLVKSFAGVYAK